MGADLGPPAEEDRTERRLDIPVPPNYTSADFVKNSYWRLRGKLDVPKERFISYPYASSDSDDSLMLGWAGWDHREQAHALITLIEERSSADGWTLPGSRRCWPAWPRSCPGSASGMTR